MFVEPVNQKSDGSISSCSSSSVSAQRISLGGRSVTRTGLAHFQGMDFRRSRYNKSVAQFDIFLLLSSPMSEAFSCLDRCWKTRHFFKAPKWRDFIFSSKVNIEEISKKVHIFWLWTFSMPIGALTLFCSRPYVVVSVDSFVSKWQFLADIYVENRIPLIPFKLMFLHWMLAVDVTIKTTKYWRLECEMSC